MWVLAPHFLALLVLTRTISCVFCGGSRARGFPRQSFLEDEYEVGDQNSTLNLDGAWDIVGDNLEFHPTIHLLIYSQRHDFLYRKDR